MSLSTSSSMATPYAAFNSGSAGGGGIVQAIESVPGDVAAGVDDLGAAVGNAASATVSFSERAMQALAAGGMTVVHGVEDVLAFPFQVAADAAAGAEQAVVGGAQLLADGFGAAIDGVEALAGGVANAVHAVAVDLPTSIVSDLTGLTQSALGDATTVAGAAASVAALTGASPLKAISTIV
jgi:hypothetical protein